MHCHERLLVRQVFYATCVVVSRQSSLDCYRPDGRSIDPEILLLRLLLLRWACALERVRSDGADALTRRYGSDERCRARNACRSGQSMTSSRAGPTTDTQQDVHPHCRSEPDRPGLPPFIIHRQKGADDGEPVDRVCRQSQHQQPGRHWLNTSARRQATSTN